MLTLSNADLLFLQTNIFFLRYLLPQAAPLCGEAINSSKSWAAPSHRPYQVLPWARVLEAPFQPELSGVAPSYNNQ